MRERSHDARPKLPQRTSPYINAFLLIPLSPKLPIRFLVLSVALIIALSFAGAQPQLATAQEDMNEKPHFTYTVTATNPRLIRNVMGEITADVQGVPAAPVHAFAWDGEGVFPIKGSATLEVDPVANTGELTAEWTDEYGSWTLTQTVFTAPPHPSGLKIAGSGDSRRRPDTGECISARCHGRSRTGSAHGL